jgi:two-component system phosphate regulon response regulator PhoB
MAKKVLIIDDNPSLADLYKEGLEIAGFDVEVSFDGISGLQKAILLKPECIILDLMLPGLSGEKVLAELKKGNDTAKIPVIIATAFLKSDSEVADIKKLADEFMFKADAMPDDIVNTVKKLIK